MTKSLIAIAVAGVLASGVAGAHAVEAKAVRVQHTQHYPGDRYTQPYPGERYTQPHPRDGSAQHYPGDRWWDDPWRGDGRRMSIAERQARILNRIRRGFDDGRLTRREARMLEDELARIEAKERMFESDGWLGRREAAELHDDLDRLALQLRSELRDDDRRYRHY